MDKDFEEILEETPSHEVMDCPLCRTPLNHAQAATIGSDQDELISRVKRETVVFTLLIAARTIRERLATSKGVLSADFEAVAKELEDQAQAAEVPPRLCCAHTLIDLCALAEAAHDKKFESGRDIIDYFYEEIVERAEALGWYRI